MEVKAYRAPTMHDALVLVRRELGPDAAVLHTREVRTSRLFGLIPGLREIEVTASTDVNVPSRLPPRNRVDRVLPATEAAPRGRPKPAVATPPPTSPASRDDSRLSDQLQGQLTDLQAMVKQLCRHSPSNRRHDLPEEMFRLFADLLDAELSEDLARELVERIRAETSGNEPADPVLAKARIARMIEAEIKVAGPILVKPGQRHLVALVGPTGVGKTTTIAKLAANYRLKENRRVGLITVDTYRIAAVEQLRTYADIIDLPMHVVSTPREMRDAVRQMSDMDLILMDTAGRSPKDEVRIQELKAFLTEAAADEVHLVLSSVASAQTLRQTAERFATVGTTALILTKLDEATALGNVLPVLRSSKLPLSYLTDGQNVPDDIATAHAHRMAQLILHSDTASHNQPH
ncbi:MAG: flagellar biosynthesis protein FlhF [Planctomycetes bacterium RBG_13_63_9]|nr:MAG: flagellar biosynthesis protein FlhF [Planctomycetes bacterium RBG_13_63_9]